MLGGEEQASWRVRRHKATLHMPSSNLLLSKLREQRAPESHLTRISDLVALAENDPKVLAIFLVGSYAKGVGDRVSDLDLVAIAAPVLRPSKSKGRLPLTLRILSGRS